MKNLAHNARIIILLLSLGLASSLSFRAQILMPISVGNSRPGTPTDSPGQGTYGSTQSVTLSDPTAAAIRYTINGSTPACPATGTLYTGAISVASTTTIKAIGCNGTTGGGVLTSVYTISASGPAITQIKYCVAVTNGNTCAWTGNCWNGTTTLSCATTTAGNAVIVALTSADKDGASLVDSGANSFTADAFVFGGSTMTGYVFSLANAPAETSTTLTVIDIGHGTTGIFNVTMFEVSGMATSSMFDCAAGNSSQTGTTYTSTTCTTGHAADFLVGVHIELDGPVVMGPDSPWIEVKDGTGTAINAAGFISHQFQIVASTGSYASTGTISLGTATSNNAISTYKGQ